MKILAFDFSGPERSVAAVRLGAEGKVLGQAEAIETGGRTIHALGMAAEVLTQAGIEREQVERIVVGLGPGSYTGIRMSISLAQGWELGRPVSLVGVSSAEAIAEEAWQEGRRGRFGVVIDAQRGEFYLAIYEAVDAGWRETNGLALVTRAAVEDAAKAGTQLIGPEAARWFPEARMFQARASRLAALSLKSGPGMARGLEPIYLRATNFVKAPRPRNVAV